MTSARPLGLTRRNILQGAGVGAAALTVAACSSNEPARPSPAADLSEQQKSLRVDSWETYRNTVGEDFPVLSQFAGTYGVDVTYSSAVKDDNLYYNKVKGQLSKGQDIGSDAVVLNQWMAARWIRLGYVQEFNLERMPNTAHIRPRFSQAAYDPQRTKSMPWRNGFTGIAWNKAELGDGPTAVSQLWDPSLKGRVGVLSSMSETMGLIMLDNGVDISGGWGDTEFAAAVEVLRGHVASGQVGAVQGANYTDDLKSGKTLATFARSADILRLNQEAGDQWGFALPSAGGVLWTQDLVIPIGSQRKTHVENFVNFYFDPSIAVQVAAGTNYVSPVDIRELESSSLDAEVAHNRMVFPTPITLEDAKTFRYLQSAEEQRYVSQFQTVLLAAS